jgi:molybdopterin converting factor small subunit
VIARASDGSIRVEFYGLARQRAETAETLIAACDPITLASLWQALLVRFPRLAEAGAASALPDTIYRINLDGQQFVTHPETPISRGQCVLIMSADAGG